MKYEYAKIPVVVAEILGLANIRRHTADGFVIVNESDMLTRGGRTATFATKVKRFGGIVLSATEAKAELSKKR